MEAVPMEQEGKRRVGLATAGLLRWTPQVEQTLCALLIYLQVPVSSGVFLHRNTRADSVRRLGCRFTTFLARSARGTTAL